MKIKFVVIIILLVATGLALALSGLGILSTVLAVASLAAIWWCFIRESARQEQSPGHPVSCCHYLGEPAEKEHEDGK